MSEAGAGPPLRVIVVEDEPELLEEIVAFLETRGVDVRGATEGGTLWRHFEAEAPDAVVLDLGLPGADGIAIARELRERAPTIGIVMMTARGSVQDRITGYETGADIYLVKPVDLGELIAAVRATLRHRDFGGPDDQGGGAEWTLDLVAWQLSAPDGGAVKLTRAEAQLLECLTRSPGTPVSRIEIGSRMGKVADLSDHRYVDQVIRRLRRKIETELGVDAPIGAAHGQGYYFALPVGRVSD